MTEVGHNSKEQLKSIIDRVENIEKSIKDHQSDRSDIYKEASSNGFDVQALKSIVRARRETVDQRAKREDREAHEVVYRSALGMAE